MRSDAAARPLEGMRVLVTRPAAQAARTAAALNAAGADAYLLPALELEALPPSPEMDRALTGLPGADLAIFVSANAVEFGMPHVLRHGGFAARTRIAAIGAATRAALAEHGVHETLAPEQGADSEALLALPDLQHVAAQHIIVFRGRSKGGGRKTLQETLTARGATVAMVETYRRSAPSADPAIVAMVNDEFAHGAIDAVHVMSVETLQNLFALLGFAGLIPLRLTPLVVPHERVAAAAQAQGCTHTHVAGLQDAELIACLGTLWRGSRKSRLRTSFGG